MKENKIEKILLSIAKVTCASTSCIGLYEPKIPEKLLKKTKRNSEYSSAAEPPVQCSVSHLS